MGCIVEEEVSPPEDNSRQNSAATMDEDPVTEFVTENYSIVATMDEDQDQYDHSHPAPDSYRLTEDHLVLIFEMQKDLAEQLHNQYILNKRLDVMFDSLSSELVKIRCPTCCHPYAFKIR